MGFFPHNPPPFVSQDLFFPESIGSIGQAVGAWGTRADAAWPAANRAIYIPFRVYKPTNFTILTMFQGGTVSGNGDFGIYSADGRLLTSTGSMAINVNANGALDGNFADILVGRGNYYIGIAVDNTTHTFKSATAVGVSQLRAMGMLQQASAFPLPATFSPAALASNMVPMCFWQMQATKQLEMQGDEFICPAFPTYHPWSIDSIGTEMLCKDGSAINSIASTAWPTANDAVWIPFVLTEPTRIQRLFCANGAAVSGNIDLGLYFANGASQTLTKLVSSGSTAQSGTSTIQTVNVDVVLGPGVFYLALGCDNTTATFLRGVVNGTALFGFDGSAAFWRNASFPLPSSVTGNNISNNYVPLIGAAQGTVV